MDDAYNPVGRPAFTNLYPQQPLPSFAGAGGAAASTAMTTAAPTPVSVGAQMNNPPLILPPLKNQGYSSLAKSQAADYSSLSTELHPSASSSLMPTSTAMATSSMNGICSQLQQGVGSAISSHVMAPSNRRGGRSIAGAMSRPTALSGPSSPTTTSGRPQAPMKDESGKFPCLYCQKKYLHAKHLKRHMLRR